MSHPDTNRLSERVRHALSAAAQHVERRTLSVLALAALRATCTRAPELLAACPRNLEGVPAGLRHPNRISGRQFAVRS